MPLIVKKNIIKPNKKKTNYYNKIPLSKENARKK